MTTSSIYISQMSIRFSEEDVIKMLLSNHVGVAYRVDFTPIHKTRGFVEKPSLFKSAFVHMRLPIITCTNECFTDNTATKLLWKTILAGDCAKMYVNKTEYWKLRLNKRPIQATMMNIHQVVDNCLYLENLIMQQKVSVEQLCLRVTDLQTQLAERDSYIANYTKAYNEAFIQAQAYYNEHLDVDEVDMDTVGIKLTPAWSCADENRALDESLERQEDEDTSLNAIQSLCHPQPTTPIGRSAEEAQALNELMKQACERLYKQHFGSSNMGFQSTMLGAKEDDMLASYVNVVADDATISATADANAEAENEDVLYK